MKNNETDRAREEKSRNNDSPRVCRILFSVIFVVVVGCLIVAHEVVRQASKASK